MSIKAHLIASQRLTVIRGVQYDRKKHGLSAARLVRAYGISHPTFSRWKRAYEEHGIEGLKPRFANCGRNKGARK